MQGQNQFLSKNNYFFKMHGTGNDFIIVNGLEKNGLITSKDQFKLLAQKLCHRKFGIGADGLLIVRKQHETYKMVVINSDGSEPNMCGNGLRCFVSLLYHLKMIPNEYNVLTDDGQKSISVARSSNQDSSVQKKYIVTLKIGSGGNIQSFPDQKYSQFYKTTIGVPHVVIYLTKEQFQTTNFQTQGREIQSNFDANINFCLINSQDSITIKTYERGAGMTYSCGTGVSSSIYVAVAKGKVNQRTVKAQTDGGQIVIELTQAFDVIMKGPAEIICEGQFRV